MKVINKTTHRWWNPWQKPSHQGRCTKLWTSFYRFPTKKFCISPRSLYVSSEVSLPVEDRSAPTPKDRAWALQISTTQISLSLSLSEFLWGGFSFLTFLAGKYCKYAIHKQSDTYVMHASS